MSVTVAPAATAATPASSTTTVTTAPAAAATGMLFPRPGNIDRYGPPAQLFAVQGVDGFLRLFRRAHGYETEAAWPTGGPVSNQIGFDYRAVRRKGVLQVVFGDFEVEVPNEQFGAHIYYATALDSSALATMFPRVGSQIPIEQVRLRISISWK